MGWLSRSLLTLVWVVAPYVALSGQGQPCVRAEEYATRAGFCVERRPLVVSRVRGSVLRLDPDGHAWADHKLPACLSLFTADSHRFVATVPADEEGHFDFGVVPAGNYRLVARAPGFPTGNDALRVVRSIWRKKRRVIVYFGCCGVDACTSTDYDRKQAKNSSSSR